MSIIPQSWHESWNDFMNDPKNIKELKNIEKQIGKNYCPLPQNVLRFLNLDLNNMKYVVVGMEPYPTLDENNKPIATGRSFEVGTVTDWLTKHKQSSLRNLLKTIYYNENGTIEPIDNIREYIKIGDFSISSPPEWFEKMESQGILFLNASLTVETDKVGPHTELWNNFMTNLAEYICSQNSGVTWMLWGRDAEYRFSPLLAENKQLVTCHPRLHGFVINNCLKKAQKVNWQV